MAKITRKNTIEENILGEFITQSERSLALMASNTVAMQNFHAAALKTAQAFNGSAKSQRDLLELDRKSEKLVQEKIKSDREIQRLTEAASKAKRAQLAVERDMVREMERANKQREKEAKALKESSSEYVKQSKRLNELRKEYKDLLLVQGRETAEMRLMRKEIIALDGALKKVDAAVGQHMRNVGHYERALGGVKNMLGQLGLAFGVFTILKDVFNIVKSNEEAMASLSAITGLTGEKFDVFQNKVQEVADKVRVSSTDVAKSFELIASAQPALLKDADALGDVTEQAIILNKAIKGDLAETSMALVGVMNQFSLSASEAARIINVLAAGSQAGAATVNQINESMVKFGTTAKLLNISVEESVGLIETLGEKAIFGADAGTALRNILLKMAAIDVLPEKAQKQLEKYGVNTDIVKDKTLSFEERLRELSKVAGDSTAIMQIFGTENATAATVLLNNLDTYNKMTDAVTGTNVANEQAAINSNTLANVLLELRAAWENYIVGVFNGTDTLNTLKSVLQFVAKNIGSIISFVVKGVVAWGTYRIALMLVNKEGTGLIQTLGKFLTVLPTTIKGVGGMTGAMKGLGAAMKTISFAGWASILVTLVPLIFEFASGLFSSEEAAKELSLAEETLNNVTKKTAERLIEEEAELTRVFEALKQTKAGTKERQEALDQVNAKYNITLENLSDEGMFVRQLDMAYQNLIATLEKKIMQEVILEEQTTLIKQRIKLQKELVQLEEKAALASAETNKTFQDFDPTKLTQTGIGRTTTESRIIVIKEQIQEINDALAALNQEDVPVLFGADAEVGGTTKSKVDAEKKKLDLLNELRSRHAALLIELENDLIQAGYDRAFIDEELFQAKKDLLEDELIFIQELNLKTNVEYEKTLNERLKLHNEYFTKLEGQEVKSLERREGIIVDQEKSLYEIMAELAAKELEKSIKRREEAIKHLRDAIVDASKLMEDFAERAIKSIDRQIDKIDEQLDASRTREEQLREEAQKRGLDATEAITLERERQKAMIAQQQELERKKMEIEALLIMLRAFAAQVEQGQGNPVANIKGSITELINFSKNLPGFIDGTDTTVEKSLGKPNLQNVGQDNYAIRVNGKERILNPELSSMIPENVSNVDLVRSYLYNKAVQKIQDSYDGNISASSSAYDAVLYETMKEQNEILKELPKKMPQNTGAFDSVTGYFKWKERLDRKTTVTIAPMRQRF